MTSKRRHPMGVLAHRRARSRCRGGSLRGRASATANGLSSTPVMRVPGRLRGDRRRQRPGAATDVEQRTGIAARGRSGRSLTPPHVHGQASTAFA